MRFSPVLLGAFAALASAQTSTPTTAPTATASLDPAQSSMIACINACQAGDVSCTSKCIAVPNPNASQVNATNECVANCPKGSGTAADNLNYSNCVGGCIGQNYFTTSGTPAPTGASEGGSGSGTAGSGASTTAAPSGSGTKGGSSPSGTNTAASTSSTNAAAEALRVGSSAVGLLGFLAAFLAI